ncbi:hypothetical protein D3C80_1388990 [compost metagenome]
MRMRPYASSRASTGGSAGAVDAYTGSTVEGSSGAWASADSVNSCCSSSSSSCCLSFAGGGDFFSFGGFTWSFAAFTISRALPFPPVLPVSALS